MPPAVSPYQKPRGNDAAPVAANSAKRPRAKRACRECNARRVRCDVMESHPCFNCQVSGADCEVFPSQRGNGEIQDVRPAARSPPPAGSADAPGALFFGESNFLTLVPRRLQGGEEIEIQKNTQGGTGQQARMLFSISNTPRSLSESTSPASTGTSRYLHDEGALTLPNLTDCVPALQAYFTWFHPCFPIIDRADFTKKLATSDISCLLLQAMLFISMTYCDSAIITSMGFSDRTEAKSLFYTRARLLFHADWEKDKITLIQSLFLVSFWRGGPSDVRDVRYWLGVVIGIAESCGLHRSARLATRDPRTARLRRRIWWSIYVRERQAAVSLGLPSRIRDDDCDIEPLSPSDLASDVDDTQPGSPFGSCNPEHITYAIKMVDIVKILGRVVDIHFAPGRQPSSPIQVQDIDHALENWRVNLLKETKTYTKNGSLSVWEHLLLLAYHHIRILIHRHNFLKQDRNNNGSIAVMAASCISRIAEDMLEQGSLRYGQMHLITSLFAALCIHTINIKRGVDVPRRIAEHRAQMCLLGLQEIQKFWRINNNILDLFLQYLDASVSQRLHRAASDEALHNMNDHGQPLSSGNQQDDNSDLPSGEDEQSREFPTPQTESHGGAVEEGECFNLVFGPWDDILENLDFTPQVADLIQIEGLDFLSRSL
ncbi:fungal-specific transcription factor domain-containing protein [Thelonectria olida]|uniref:Fungal-specific transcription factor domain-containing protein n=1 Tax=Thelonectria olida TaxID=1576542 RepID=A0A9P8VPI7_9HYPO|nr:fungal-specific transcription factor domain-containing protein [Thelonectria olida]